MPQTINLVLQGGGVKGIALVGALNAIENNHGLKGNILIDGVGGVSVGALVAALYAAGYSAAELSDVLNETPISELIDRPPMFGVLGAFQRIRKQKGIYSTQRIYSWVRDLLEKKGVTNFSQLKRTCRIFAANVTRGTYQIFSQLASPGEEVASAVVASLSIPIFFAPYIAGHQLFVDGGMLSNYPLWLFKDSKWPTVGIKLIGRTTEGPGAGASLIDFLAGLVSTMLGAHDQLGLGNPPNAQEIVIKVEEVDTTDFHAEDLAQKLLYERGQSAVGQFAWNNLPPPRVTVFDDRNGGQILEDTANSIALLLDRTVTNAKRSFDYYHTLYLIKPNGLGECHRELLIRNHGPEPISWMQYAHTYDYEVDVSFRDLLVRAECAGGPPPNEVVVLPTGNTRLQKSYALALIPPLLPGEYREIKISTCLPDFFRKFVNYEADNIHLTLAHESGIQDASLTLRLEPSLGAIVNKREGGATPRLSFREEPPCNYVWKFGGLPAGRNLEFKVSFRRG